jgi:ABC-type multidrug transport system fused ATPase/permease subunit
MAGESKTELVKAGSLLAILRFLGKYPARVALCLSLLLVAIGIEMTLPQVIGNAINAVRRSVESGTIFSPWHYVSLLLSLVLARSIVSHFVGTVRNRITQPTLGDIRAAIYNALQRLAFQYHDKANTGELISRATTDVWRLQDFLHACLLLSVDIAVSLAVTTGLIFSISPALGCVAVGTIVPTMGLIGFFATKLRPQWRHVHDLHGAMTTVIQENIAGVRVVKAFAREQAQIDKFRNKKDNYLGFLLETVNYWAARVPMAQFIYGLSVPLALWIGGRQVIQGKLDVGDLTKVVLYLMALGYRVGMVGQVTNIIQNASASAERILEIIREPCAIKNGKLPLPPGPGRVVFEAVGFNYTNGKASLHDVSFVAEPGQTVAVVGPTGAGKTTLVNLIPRFYDPSSGRVSVDGVGVHEVDVNELRRAVSIIFQETFLFSASVAENIAYGKPSASDAEIEKAARAAQAHEFITGLEAGYDTVIGERGISLSGGQRQRIAIARAFLMDPRILILDDATASVDSQTERLIREAMRQLCEGRTTFVIAQRFSTVKHADLILVLKQGRIVQQGRHEDLLREGGFYRDVCEQQIRHG